jgi:hypothetical protein
MHGVLGFAHVKVLAVRPWLGVRPELSLPGTRLESQKTSNLYKSSCRRTPVSHFSAAYLAKHGMCAAKSPGAAESNNMSYFWDRLDEEDDVYVSFESGNSRANLTQTAVSEAKKLAASEERTAGSFLPASLLESMFAMTIFDDGESRNSRLRRCSHECSSHITIVNLNFPFVHLNEQPNFQKT